MRQNRDVGYAAVVWRGEQTDGVVDLLQKVLLHLPIVTQRIAPGVWMTVEAEHAALFTALPDNDLTLYKLAELRTLISSDQTRRNLAYFSFIPSNLWRRGGRVLQCGIRRGDDLIYFDTSEGILWRFPRYFAPSG